MRELTLLGLVALIRLRVYSIRITRRSLALELRAVPGVAAAARRVATVRLTVSLGAGPGVAAAGVTAAGGKRMRP